MKYKCTNAFYFNTIQEIGGIESHFNYIARKYGKYDITIFYQKGEIKQLKRLKQYIRAIKIDKQDAIECDNLFVCFNREVLDIAKAKHIYLVLHGDYKAMVEQGQLSKNLLPIDERIDEYIGVSQTICDSWFELTGLKAKCVYQPIVLDEVDKSLLFISATRLSKEKGFERMKKLAKAMNDAGINYQWFVYTNQPKEDIENIVYVKPRIDIANHLRSFDAYIQLSDNEGYCLSVVEALLRHIPVIITDLPVFKELGIDDSNSIRLNLDMQDIPLDKIRNIYKLNVNYQAKQDKWDNVLIHKPSTYKAKDKYKIRYTSWWAEKKVYDMTLNRVPLANEIVEISADRYEYLKDIEKEKGFSLIEEVEEEQRYV